MRRIEQDMINFATVLADRTGKPWEVFRDGRGAVDVALAGTCAECPKFRLLATVNPSDADQNVWVEVSE